MRRTVAVICSLLAFGHVQGAERQVLQVDGLDGLVVAIRNEQGKKGEEIVGHTIKEGKLTGSATIFKAEDRIINACLSPFGNQVAFIKPGGTVAVVGVDGKDARELADDALWLQWPASDGARWIYYMDAKDKATLRRVNVKTKESQAVVTFDQTIEFAAMSQDASPNSGWLIAPGGDSRGYACVYPMARGSGSTIAVPAWWQLTNNQLCISPDNTVFGMLAPDGRTFLEIGMPWLDDTKVGYRLDPVSYRNRPGTWFRDVADWRFNNVAGPHAMKDAFRIEEQLGLTQAQFVQPVWSVNHPGWVLFSRLNPGSSDMVLQDVDGVIDHGGGHCDIVTENAAGVFERPVGFWDDQPAQCTLGYYRGKAPFTVQFDDDRIQEEMTWDFGDGSPRVKGRSVQHTYAQGGHFTVVAEKGAWAKPLLDHLKDPTDRLYFGDVTVAKAAPPEGQAYVVDATHLLVTFSEPMQAKDAQVSLGGKAKVAKWALMTSGRQMAVQLAEPLTKDDKLQLKGFFDLGQQPNALKDGMLKVTVPAWPSDRSRLVFLWDDVNQCNAVFNRVQSRIQMMELFYDGPKGGIDSLGRLSLTGADGTGFKTGLGTAGSIGSGFGNFGEITQDSTLSFECTFQPDNLTQTTLREPRRIVSCSTHRKHVWCFGVGQQGDRLLVSIKTEDNWLETQGHPRGGSIRDESGTLKNLHLKPEERKGFAPYFYGQAPWFEVATLTDTRPHHLVVTYKPGLMVTYLDGEKVYETDRITGQLNWPTAILILGAWHGWSGDGDSWAGNLEGVAMYSRFLEAAEVKRNFVAYSKKVQAREESMGQSGKTKGTK